MERKYLIVIVIILVVTIGVFGYFFYTLSENKRGNSSSMKNTEQGFILPIKECYYADSGKTIEAATKDKNVDICDCIEDAQMKDRCVESTQNAVLYEKAIKELNADVCNQLKDKLGSDTCKSNVQSMLEYKKNKK